MRLNADTLDNHLNSDLARVYLIASDEHLLVSEAHEKIRNKAKEKGFLERDLFEAGKDFDWSSIASASANLSLFASQRILDLRLPTGKPGREGGKFIREYLENQPADDLLIITSAHLNKSSMSTAWVKAIEQAGAIVQCWPIKGNDLPPWLDSRMRARGLQPDAQAARALAARTEGNLLAAAQEIEKILLVKGEGPVTMADIKDLVADGARFDVFALMDAALGGETRRALRMARVLQAEDTPLPIVAWALTREVRLISQLRYAMNHGGNPQQLFRMNGVWDSRKKLMERAVRRHSLEAWQGMLDDCGRIDRASKGRPGYGLHASPWQQVEQLLVKLSEVA